MTQGLNTVTVSPRRANQDRKRSRPVNRHRPNVGPHRQLNQAVNLIKVTTSGATPLNRISNNMTPGALKRVRGNSQTTRGKRNPVTDHRRHHGLDANSSIIKTMNTVNGTHRRIAINRNFSMNHHPIPLRIKGATSSQNQKTEDQQRQLRHKQNTSKLVRRRNQSNNWVKRTTKKGN